MGIVLGRRFWAVLVFLLFLAPAVGDIWSYAVPRVGDAAIAYAQVQPLVITTTTEVDGHTHISSTVSTTTYQTTGTTTLSTTSITNPTSTTATTSTTLGSQSTQYTTGTTYTSSFTTWTSTSQTGTSSLVTSTSTTTSRYTSTSATRTTTSTKHYSGKGTTTYVKVEAVEVRYTDVIEAFKGLLTEFWQVLFGFKIDPIVEQTVVTVVPTSATTTTTVSSDVTSTSTGTIESSTSSYETTSTTETATTISTNPTSTTVATTVTLTSGSESTEYTLATTYTTSYTRWTSTIPVTTIESVQDTSSTTSSELIGRSTTATVTSTTSSTSGNTVYVREDVTFNVLEEWLDHVFATVRILQTEIYRVLFEWKVDPIVEQTVVTVQPAPPQLVVIKHVINDNVGDKQASDFTMNVTGDSPNPSTFPGNETGTTVTLNPGDYSVDEQDNPWHYTKILSGDCSGTIQLGETKTCTITNHDPQLIVYKHVIGGTKVASDFTIHVTDSGPPLPATFPGSEDGTTIILDQPTSYAVSEDPVEDYVASYSADCTGQVNEGQLKICTITNEYTGGQPTQPPVGGELYSPSRMALLEPWLALLAIVGLLGMIFIMRRRREA